MTDRRHAPGTAPLTAPTLARSSLGAHVRDAARDHPAETPQTLLAAARDHLAGWRFRAARQVLAAAYAALGRTDHTDDLAAQIAILYAEVLRDTDRLADAQALAEPLVDDLTNRYGLRHPATVQALAVLGAIYHDLDRLGDADDCYDLVMRSGAPPQGPAGRAIRRTAANLALLHHDRGDTTGAADELIAAHAALHAVQGAANPDTLHVAADLAQLLHRLGRTADAYQLLTASITAARAGLSDDHPLVGRLNADLISLTGRTDQPDQPVPLNPRADLRPGGPTAGRGRHRAVQAALGAGLPLVPGVPGSRLLMTAPLVGAAVGLAVAALLGVASSLRVDRCR